MPALPLVTSGAGTLLAYVALMVALAVLVGAVIGLLANRPLPTPREEPAQSADHREDLRRAA